MKPFGPMFRSFSFVVISFSLFLSLILGGSSRLEASPFFTVQKLGALGSSAALASGLNSSGQAVGFVTTSSGDQTPVLFGSGTATQLGGVGVASGINDAGVVVGTTYSQNVPTVTEWSNGQSKTLGITGYGTSINNSGEIAGGYQTSSGQLHAFTLNGGSLVDLGTLGGGWSTALAVNGNGQVAGTSTTDSGAFRAFFATGAGMSSLGTLGGWSSYGLGLNSEGEVVGSSQISSGYLHAFSWTSGKMSDLGTLGGSVSSAYGVNDQGSVVGYSLTDGNRAAHGFLDANGIMFDLNDLLPIASGWTITGAYAINNAGDILGTASYDNDAYAVELDPLILSSVSAPAFVATPEPAALALVAIGLMATVCFGRRRRKVTSR